MIRGFRRDSYFLSNFYLCGITYNGMKFTNAEALFQSFKALNRQHEYCDLTGKEAKRKGRTEDLPSNWDEARLPLMEGILRLKFTQNDNLKQMLLNTGEQELIESNTWHDNFWGSCECSRCGDKGENNLGKLLMKIRKELSE